MGHNWQKGDQLRCNSIKLFIKTDPLSMLHNGSHEDRQSGGYLTFFLQY